MNDLLWAGEDPQEAWCLALWFIDPLNTIFDEERNHPQQVNDQKETDMTSRQKMFIEISLACGLSIVGMRYGKRHLVLRCRTPKGSTVVFPIPGTPSDHRVVRNFRAQMRRASVR